MRMSIQELSEIYKNSFWDLEKKVYFKVPTLQASKICADIKIKNKFLQ